MKDFSLQLYSLRDIPTLRERLQIAADTGYTGVEFCGYEDFPADEMKSILASLGLRPTGSHISQEALQADLNGCIAYAKQLGITSVTCPWIVMQTAEDAVKAAAFLVKKIAPSADLTAAGMLTNIAGTAGAGNNSTAIPA